MSSSTFNTYNPATGDLLNTYKYLNEEEAKKELLHAQKDFEVWRKSTFAERWETALALAEMLRRYKNDIVESMSKEMGKSTAEGKAEVDKCIATCEYYAKDGEKLLSPRKVESGYQKSWVSFQPQGVILSIMPWNFPLWQVMRFAVPAIMAGNVIILKHADITTGTAEIIAKVFADVRKDITLLRHMPMDHDVVATLIGNPLVRGVTFTGSSRGGKEVAITAAKHLKKTVLELGGSDAYLILEDANLEWAAKTCVKARLVNNGQSCVAGKRFIVVESVAKKFTELYVEAMKKEEAKPLAHKRFQKQIAEQVEILKSVGGKVLLGGTMPEGAGAFYPPTVMLFEKDHAKIHSEEVFGPVASIIVAKNQQEAFKMANEGPYGLGGGIFTANEEKGRELIEKNLDAGFVVVNDYVKSDPRLPFGGVKDSGYGRELGEFGIMEFVNIKTVAVGNVL